MSLRPIPVLLYHRIEPEGGGTSTAISTPVDVFRSHLRWLAEHGYQALTVDQLRNRIDGTEPQRTNEVVITFDDGYASLPRLAAPVLREHGFTADAFLITQLVGKDDYLDWTEARDLADEGLIGFHSHSHSHNRWVVGSGSVADVVSDLSTSRQILEAELGKSADDLTFLAWPYGRTCEAWSQAAAELGFTTQFIVQRGAVTRPDHVLGLPRLMVDGMPLDRFSRWMRTLHTRPGAHASNRAFASVRRLRGNPGYV